MMTEKDPSRSRDIAEQLLNKKKDEVSRQITLLQERRQALRQEMESIDSRLDSLSRRLGAIGDMIREEKKPSGGSSPFL